MYYCVGVCSETHVALCSKQYSTVNALHDSVCMCGYIVYCHILFMHISIHCIKVGAIYKVMKSIIYVYIM